MKKLFTAVVVLVGAVAMPLQAAYTWSSVQIWGGGYVSGAAFHPTEQGLAYLRTDVGGAYRLNADRRTWLPLNDMFISDNDMGSVAIGLDAGDANAVYSTGGLYLDVSWCGAASFLRSTNRGAAWTKIVLNSTTVSGTASSRLNGDGALCLGGNGVNRGTGNRIAARGNNIYLGTDQNGLLRSTDRGNTWSTVSASPFTNTVGISAVLFDDAGNVYAAPFTGGIYMSANGTAWSRVGTFGGIVYQMSYSPQDNTIWFTTNTNSPLDQNGPGGGSVHRLALSTNTFTQVTMPGKGSSNYGYLGVSVNPRKSSQVLVSTGGWWKGSGGPISGSSFRPHEAIFMSMDGGQNWKDILLDGAFDAATAYNAASSNPHWISALAVNPRDSAHVIFGTGYGVWSTFNATANTPSWSFTSKGIEETVPLGLASTKYGAPLVSVLGDVDGFYHNDLNTPPLTRHKMGNGTSEAGTNYDIDFAGQKHEYMVRIHKGSSGNFGAWSENGGKTWNNFGSRPPVGNYQNEDNYVAVSANGSAIVWNMKQGGVYYSTNNGTTWTASSTSASLLQGFRPVADKVTAGTFYLYNPVTGTLYRSTNNGAAWTSVNTTMAVSGGDWANGAFRLYASPDQAGELWATRGVDGVNGIWLGNSRGIARSTNGGTTFTTLSGIVYAKSIGFGRGRNTANPSAVYVVGIGPGNEDGVFRSDNSGGTWTRINDNNTMYGGISMIIGDPCVYSRVFMGTAGRGIVQGIDNAVAAPCDCVNRIDYGPTSVSGKAPVNSLKKPALVRQGRILRSSAPIRLYTLNGRLVAASSSSGPEALVTLNLARVPNGVYVARSGAETLRVRLQQY